MTEGPCLASYSRDQGKFSMFFSMVFQASKDKKFRGEKQGKFRRIWRFDFTHSANIALQNNLLIFQ